MQPGRSRLWWFVTIACVLTPALISAGGGASARGASREVLTVGDSLTFGSLTFQNPAFLDAGWTSSHVSARGSRGITTKAEDDPYNGLTAVDALRKNFGDSDEWVVALGTNDARSHEPSRYADLIRRMMDRIGRGRRVVWVNVYLPYDGAGVTTSSPRGSRFTTH